MLSGTYKINKVILSIFILLIAGLFIFAANDSFAATVRLASITGIEVPTRVAVDTAGNIYVTEPSKNRLQIFNRHGALVDTINGLKGPLGVAVDGAGRIYIGNDGADNIGVYSSDHTLIYKLGKGDGEFNTPNSIVVSSSGMIYVSDSRDNLIKVYNPDGSPALSFGGFGSGSGQFNSPLGLAIDETAGELYVTDLGIFTDPQNGPTAGARVQVFDLNGVFKRSFGEYGTGDGKLIRPLGIALDSDGKVYVTDSFQGVAQAFDATGNWIETIYDLQNPMKTPIGIAIGKDNRIFIASLNTPSVEIYGLSDYTFLTVTPGSLTFSTQAGINPDPQTINIGNTGTGSLDWAITTSASWITIDQNTGTAGPSGVSAVSAGINADGLGVGTHTGTITVTSPGATETISVTLEVLPPPVLEVSPLSLSFQGQESGGQPSSQTVSVAINNDITGKSGWSAASSAPWLTAGPASGSSVLTTVSVSANTTGLTAGTYSGSITITSAGATGSPAAISVNLTLTSAGGINVTTNLQEASFSITGTAKYQGTGLSWSETNAPSGQYTITFNKVAGYKTPAPQTFAVSSGKGITITGQYKDLRASKKIIAGAGPLSSNPAQVRVFNTDGTKGGADFIAFSLKYGACVAAGDIDGDGIDEIIVGAGDEFVNPARIKAFYANGTAVSGADFLAFTTKYGANVASADLDGDGKAEIIAGAGKGIANVRVFTYNGGTVTDTGINFICDATLDGVQVAAGDIDGDGQNEIITASVAKSSQTIKVWKVDTSGGPGKWTATEDKSFRAFTSKKGIVVATGDLNGDGTDEIIAGEATGANVKVFKGDGTPYGVEFSMSNTKGDGTPYGVEFSMSNTTGAVGIAAGDTDSDGVAEIIIGTDTNRKTPGEIKVYKADGSPLNSFKPFNYGGGVNIGLGKFE